jgi:hypothetical protein
MITASFFRVRMDGHCLNNEFWYTELYYLALVTENTLNFTPEFYLYKVYTYISVRLLLLSLLLKIVTSSI